MTHTPAPQPDAPSSAVEPVRDAATELFEQSAVQVAGHAAAALSPSTRRAYRSGWTAFTGWCEGRGVEPLPADPFTVAAFLSDAEAQTRDGGTPRWSVGTLSLWGTAINRAHAAAGYPGPIQPGNVAASTMAGIRRERGTRPRRVRPAGVGEVKAMIDAMDFTTWPSVLAATRDAAVLLVGLAGAMRRSELSGLDVADCEPQTDGSVHVLVRRSKTDQEGEGMVKYLPRGEHPELCPSCALWRWVRLVRMADRGMSRAALMGAVLGESRGVHICQDRWVTGQWSAEEAVPLFRPLQRAGHIYPASITPPDGEGPVAGARSRYARPDGRYAALSGASIQRLIRSRAAAAGLNPSLYGGHSLRAGFVTDAFRAGADTVAVKRQTGHKSDTAVAVYDRENTPGRGNAVNQLGF